MNRTPAHPKRPATRSRLRAAMAPLALGILIVAASACGSDSGSDSDGAAEGTVAVADPPVAVTTPADTTGTAPVSTDAGSGDASDGGGDAAAECGGLNAAQVGAAVGAEFDSADDTSVDTDETCLFSSTTAVDGVTVMTESVDTYLGGMLAGLAPDDALAQLVSAESVALDEGFGVEQTTAGGNPAVILTGSNSMVGSPTGYAATVADGVVIEVTLDGAGLSPDADGFGPLAAAVLELAVAAQG